MSKKGGNKKQDKEFDQVLKFLERDHLALKTPKSQVTWFSLVGFFIAIAPIVLYLAPIFDGSLGWGILLVILSVIVNAALVSHAYVGVADRLRKSLYSERSDATSASDSKVNAPILEGVRAESAAYALFSINLTFLVVFLFMVFYVLRGFPSLAAQYHFTLCSIISAGGAYGASKFL